MILVGASYPNTSVVVVAEIKQKLTETAVYTEFRY